MNSSRPGLALHGTNGFASAVKRSRSVDPVSTLLTISHNIIFSSNVSWFYGFCFVLVLVAIIWMWRQTGTKTPLFMSRRVHYFTYVASLTEMKDLETCLFVFAPCPRSHRVQDVWPSDDRAGAVSQDGGVSILIFHQRHWLTSNSPFAVSPRPR
jgi:hypothetical protein